MTGPLAIPMPPITLALLTWIDWTIIAAMLVGITIAGHVLVGRRTHGARGFFLGDRSMPWWAVAASMIATKVSALTFIALPASVFVAGGDIRYVQITIGFIIGNVLMAMIFVKPYFESGVYSPYDYMGRRIDPRVAVLAKLLFLVGTVLSQGVRLLATSVVLAVVTGLPIAGCIAVIVGFSVAWSCLGGIKTVIWTDAMLFVIFMIGGVLAMVYAFTGAELPLPEAIRLLDEKAKLVMIDLAADPRKAYTLWAGLIGAALFELGSNSIDQVVTQRVMTCRSARDAQKACIGSALGVLPSYLMLATGLGLFVFYHQNPLPAELAGYAAKGSDKIFPHFVATQMPAGLSGLIIAALFAAGISTLDSALAALAQTTVGGLRRIAGASADAHDAHNTEADRRVVRRSRLFVTGWGVVLGLMAVALISVQGDSGKGLLDLGLAVPGYVYGSLLGIALLARFGRGDWPRVLIATVAAIAAVVGLKLLGVWFMWWYPVAAIVVLLIAVWTPARPNLLTRSES